MICLSLSLMYMYVSELAGWLLFAYTELYIGWFLSKLRMCSVSLSTNRFVFFPIKTQTNSWHQTLSLCPHLFLMQIYSNAGNLSSVVISSTHIYPKQVFQYSQHIASKSSTRFDLSLHEVTLGLPNNQFVPLENNKNLIFHINPIQTAMKKIITAIFLKTR